MVEQYIRQFTIITLFFFTFFKISSIKKIKYSELIYSIIATSVLSSVSCLIYYSITSLVFVLQLIALIFSVFYIFKNSLYESIAGTIMSYGLVYVIFIVCGLASSILFWVFKIPDKTPTLVIKLVCSVMQIIITILLFHIRRFRSGLKSMMNNLSDSSGVIICCIIFLMVILCSATNNSMVIIIGSLSIILCGVFFIVWWRTQLTQHYILKTKMRENNEIHDDYINLQESNKNITEDNQELARIIHRDNKLIPATKNAVTEFFDYCTSEKNVLNIQKRASELKTYIDSIYNDRKGVLINYESHNSIIDSTGSFETDSAIKYMHIKAESHKIKMEFHVVNNILGLLGQAVKESDLCTMLSDLIDNAIIATEFNSKENILINMYNLDNVLCFDVMDSGIPFTEAVLKNMGKKEITTHKDTGGSGIGLFNTIALLDQYNASMEIKTFEENNMFTKSISIKFDGQNNHPGN